MVWGVSKNSTPVSTAPIKIGVIGPYTGGLSQYGEAYRNGILLAQKELNTQGKNIQFIFEDSVYDTAKAVSAFKKLTTVDKVDLVMDWGAATGYGIAPLVEGSKTPFVAFSVDPEVTKSSKYIIRHFYSPDDFAAKLWTYFRSEGYKDVAIVKLKLLYYDKITESLLKLKMEDETVTIVDEYQSFGDNDFRSSVAKINAKKDSVDVLGVFLGGGQIAQFYKQADALKLKLPTFGADFFESNTEIENANGLMNGAVYANIGVTDDFINRYRQEFGNENQISFAGQSYDFVNILVNKIDFTNADTIISSFKKIKNYSGIMGSYTYSDSNGDQYLKSDLYIKEIDGNKIKVIQ